MHYDKFKSITENTVKWDLTGQIRKNLLLSSKNCPKQEIILYCNREKPKLVITVKQTFRRQLHNVLTFYLSTLKELMEQQVLFLVL